MSHNLVILVAEDDESDVFILNRALKLAGIEASLQFVNDGQYAVDYLAGIGEYADRAKYPLPHFAIFDIKMPRMTGFDALAWVRSQKRFESLPVMIISSSDEERDIKRANALGVSAYLVKPSDAEKLAHELLRFRNFWWPFMEKSSTVPPRAPGQSRLTA